MSADTRIWLIQWLCPTRHCAWAVPFVPALGQTREATETAGWQVAHAQGFRDVCGICGQPISPEAARTRFELAEWDAFMAYLEQGQRDQAAVRHLLDRLGQTTDVQRDQRN